VAGTGLRPLVEELWRKVKSLPEAGPLVEERPYVPPVVEKGRSEEEKFEYAEGEADEEAWEAVDEGEGGVQLGGVRDAASGRGRRGLINAAGDEVVLPEGVGVGGQKKKSKVKRTMIEPVVSKAKDKKRSTAKERKKLHEERVKKKLGSQAASPPAVETPADVELAAEVEAMKADDARKGKYYNRGKKKGEAAADPFYSEENQAVLRRSIQEANEGKFITKTLDELRAMEE